MKGQSFDQSATEKLRQKTQYSNLIRYVPSRKYYARLRVKGKLIVKSLKTTVLSVAKLRLSDLETKERSRVESSEVSTQGKMTVNGAIDIHKLRLKGDKSIKDGTRSYHDQRITAPLKSWPMLGG